jgi:4-carboxymuconolactone decarboxylase
MRLPLISPSDLSSEQRPVYEDMRTGIEQTFQGFSSIAENGALMGPWNPWLHEPKFGKPIWELTKALSFSPSLPKQWPSLSPVPNSELPMKSTLT